MTARMGPQQREHFNSELYAPAGGWDAADAALHARIAAAEEG